MQKIIISDYDTLSENNNKITFHFNKNNQIVTRNIDLAIYYIIFIHNNKQ